MRSSRVVDEIQPSCGGDLAELWMRSRRVWMRSSRVWMRSNRVVDEMAELWMRSSRLWMRSSRVVIERLAANAKVATVLGAIPASSDAVESEGRQMKQC
jgi:hypothetical protein